MPLFVVDVVRQPSSWAGAALTAFALGTVATLPLGGHLADRWGRRQPVIVGSLVVAATTIWLGATASLPEVLVVCVLSGAGTGVMTPAVNATMADALAKRDGSPSGAAVAGYQMTGDAGAVIGPPLAAWAVDLGGYSAAFGLTALIAVGSLLWWRHVPRKDRDPTG